MSLRDRLSAKARRHLDHPVVIDDPQVAAAAVGVQEQLWFAARMSGEAAEIERTKAALEAAKAALTACYEFVGFDALDPNDYEDLTRSFLDDDGRLDVDAVLPALAAACASDEDLRDPEYWATELGSGRWNAGEIHHLFAELTALNQAIPPAGLGKG